MNYKCTNCGQFFTGESCCCVPGPQRVAAHTLTPAEVIAEIESEERARAAAHSRVTCIDGSHARAAIAYLRSYGALMTALEDIAVHGCGEDQAIAFRAIKNAKREVCVCGTPGCEGDCGRGS